MARKKKNELRKFPEFIEDYFSVSSYNDCAKWGLREWTNALKVRQGRLVFLRDEPVRQAWPELAKKAADMFIEDPLRMDSAGDWFVPRSAIKDLNVGTLEYLVQKIDESGRPLERDMSVTSLLMGIRAGEEGRQTAYLSLDLTTPDEVLAGQFKAWLGEARQAYGMPPDALRWETFSQKNYDAWHEQRLLPYIDLVTWNRMNGDPLNDADVKELLGREALGTTHSNALALLARENGRAMEKQLTHEFYVSLAKSMRAPDSD